MSDHEAIYLQPLCAVFDDDFGRVWSQNDAPDDCDCPDGPHPWVKYVRADISARSMITEDEMRAKLREACDAAGSLTKWCSLHGYKPPYVSGMIHGNRPIGERTANDLGFTRKVHFFPCNGTE